MRFYRIEQHERTEEDRTLNEQCAYCLWPIDPQQHIYLVVSDTEEEFPVCSEEHVIKLVYKWGLQDARREPL